MLIRAICLLTLTLSLTAVQAEPVPGTLSLGIRGGFAATDTAEEPQQYELFMSYVLPWYWGSDWLLGTRFNAGAGVLTGGSESSFIGALGPALTLQRVAYPLWLELGMDIAVLSDNKLEDDDFGDTLQFISHVGLNVRLSRHWEAGYRFQHMSNAGLDVINPGLDMHMLQLGYRF